MLLPRARTSGHGPRSPRARRSSAPCRPARPGRAPRPQAVGDARGPWGGERPVNRPRLAGGVRRRWPSLISAAAGAGRGWPARQWLAPAVSRGPTSLADGGRTRSLAGRRSASWSASSRWPCSCGRWCGSLAWRLRRGTPPGARPAGAGRRGRCCGSWTRPAPGSSRSTPARSRRRGCGARRQGRHGRRGLHGAADPGAHHGQRRRLPGRRHPARRLRARRRLAARRPGEDRQARVPRQLRHGGAGPQGAQAGPGRRPVGRPAPQARPRAGTSWLGSPPAELRRAAEDADDARTYHPPTRLRAARGFVEARCGCVPLVVPGPALARRRGGARGPGRPAPAGGRRPLLSRRGDDRRPARSRRA